MVPSAYQVVAGRLTGAVGAVGLVLVLFCEGRVLRRQAAVHLIGRHMQKAKAALGFGTQTLPVAAHRFQQTEGAHNVGLNEVAGAMNGTVNMAFCRKVQHGTGLVLCQQFGQQF